MSSEEGCYHFDMDDYYMEIQKRNSRPMPWIGMYVAAASAICLLAMAADVFNGVRRNFFWFPSKFFGLNATSLTLLAVALKLPVDITTPLWGNVDKLSKLCGLIFLSTAMGNCMTSLGSMNDQEILMNVTALCILVITVFVNVCIQFSTNVADYSLWAEYILAAILMFVLLLTFVCTSLYVPITKKYIEAKYQDMHQVASSELREERGRLSINYLKLVVTRYWVMATTSNPQFVIARSATCATSGAICLLSALTLLEAELRINKVYGGWKGTGTDSDYQWSTTWILVTQSLGVAIGILPPTLRWFTAVRFKCSKKGRKSYKNMLNIETYWVQRLEEWKESPLPLPFKSIKCRKLLHNAKYLFLTFCIKVQIVIVVASKFILLLCASLLGAFLLFLRRFRVELKSESSASTNQNGQESETVKEQDLSNYVILLEGEVELPKRTLRNIFFEADRLILAGKKQQPKYLIELLEMSSSFNCIADFESDHVPSLCSEEPPNCWTLPVVTLTSIALALPNVENHIADRLLRSVSEGLHYANLVEKWQDIGRKFVSIQNTADIVWVGVELYRKWLDEDLKNLEGRTSKEILQALSEKAERSMLEFKKSTNGKLMENPVNWPVKIIAANSMHRISRSLLLSYIGDNHITDEQLFENISVMIAGIFGACLTNLPHVIASKCHSDAIEERESSVKQSAILLGETQHLLEIIQQHQLSGAISDQVACINEWRVSLKLRNSLASIPASANEAACSTSNEVNVSIEMEAKLG